MKQEKTNLKSGFTLLELLVVVLIIGILAAIALPKYQLAVDKAQFIKLQSMAASIRTAYSDYILVHGTGTKKFEDLAITLPSDFQSSFTSAAFNCVSNDTMFCCITKNNDNYSATIMCGKNDLSFLYASITGGYNKRNDKCKAAKDNARAHRLCSNIGTKSGTANGYTPQGVISSYTNYILK